VNASEFTSIPSTDLDFSDDLEPFDGYTTRQQMQFSTHSELLQ
jgi:hypothetical protein